MQVTDALGQVFAEWRGIPEDIAIAPDGAVFYWPFTTTRFSQLFRIQRHRAAQREDLHGVGGPMLGIGRRLLSEA